jgi:threonine dehydratase
MSSNNQLVFENLDQRVLCADERIRPAVRETPCEDASDIIPGLRSRLLFKREDLQHTGSFKLRGATNKLLSLTPQERAAGVIAASNGNHGLGVAYAARNLGIKAEVYVSKHVSPGKARKIEGLGARICYAGEDPLAAEIAGRKAAVESEKVFVSPYNDADVMAGQGTIAVELLRQAKPDAVYVAVGGGGLIGGIGAYLKSASPETEVIGCWPHNSPVLYECMKAGRVIDVPERSTLSESTAGGLEPGSITLDVCNRVIDHSIFVSEGEILAAIRLVQKKKGWLMEGAAGVALAAFLQECERYAGKTVAVVICGGNLSAEALRQVL